MLTQHNETMWRFLDHSTIGLSMSALKSFAYDDLFCTFIGQGTDNPLIRTWVHRNTVVLGIQDSRLPYIEEGHQFLKEKGYDVIVRNSGGLAVPLDPGILNISLIVKEKKGLSIDAGYELMYHLIKKMLAPFDVKVEAYEIVGSYCPGSYDLSICGEKFAGTSQRRIRGGVSIQLYLCVTGSGSERAQFMRTFYEIATRGEETTFTYPQIVPSTMASLSELVEKEMTIPMVMERLLITLQEEGIHLITHNVTDEERAEFTKQYERILRRNDKFLAEAP